jgi:hypothetical protein
MIEPWIKVVLKSARAAGGGAKKWRNPPVQPRFGGQDLSVSSEGNGGTVQASVKDVSGKPSPDSHVRLVPDAPRRAQMSLYGECKTGRERSV